MSSKEDKMKDSHSPPSHEVKWKNSQQYDMSNYPPKLKSQVSMCHIYLLYSVTMVCLMFSTYSFSHIYQLQQEVCNSEEKEDLNSILRRLDFSAARKKKTFQQPFKSCFASLGQELNSLQQSLISPSLSLKLMHTMVFP